MSDNESTKTFTLEQILTITHGRFLCDVGEVYEILNWLTGDNLMTHQLPRASREAEGPLLDWFPELQNIDVSDWEIRDEQDVIAYMAGLAGEYGATRDLPRLAPGDHTRIDPISEIKMIRPDMTIIAVGGDDA